MLMILKQCHEQGILIQWFHQQKQAHPDVPLFGIVLLDDTLIGLDSDHNVGPYHSFREHFGEEAWRLCHYPTAISVTGYSTEPPVPRSSHNKRWRGESVGRRAKRQRQLQTITRKAREFIVAVTGKKVSDEVHRTRLAICGRNECKRLIQREGKLYCGACGCGEWKLAELHSKLKFARLSCPLGLWGRDDKESADVRK